MSFLTSSVIVPDTGKAVISLWFRVPQKSIDDITTEYQEYLKAVDAANAAGTDPPPRRPFLGIVPLMTFGPTSLKAREYYLEMQATGPFPGRYEETWSNGPFGDCVGAGWQEVVSDAGDWEDSHYTFTPGGTLSGKKFDLDGSYIGVECTSQHGDFPALSVNIVMPESNRASMPGAYPAAVEHTSGPAYFLSGSGCGVTMHFAGPDTQFPGRLCYDTTHFSSFETVIYEGNADVVAGRVPETFRLLPAQPAGAHSLDVSFPSSRPYKSGAKIEADHWHHLLLSFDFTNQVSTKGQLISQAKDGTSTSGDTPVVGGEGGRTSSTGLMWVALDNKNLTRLELSAFWPDGYSNPNGVLPINGMVVAQYVNFSIVNTNIPISVCDGIDLTTTQVQQLPEYSYLPSSVSFANLGLPASKAHSDAVRQVEMAELQIFTGVALDTGKTVNRLAFIGNGKPVPPTQKKEVDPSTKQVTKESGSIELLGKEPELLLHKSRNWIKGISTGSLATGVDRAGKTTPTLEPVGEIISYKPDPSLGGDQGKKDPPKPSAGGP